MFSSNVSSFSKNGQLNYSLSGLNEIEEEKDEGKNIIEKLTSSIKDDEIIVELQKLIYNGLNIETYTVAGKVV